MAQQSLRFGTLRLMRDATLGGGAYGQVCKATLDELPCAAKLLHPILVDPNNPRNRTRFEQECRFLSEIRHPNIVQHLGVAQDGETGLPILLMELMDDSLTHFLEQSEEPLAYHVQVNISHDIALAIAFLHLNRIVHRDLSSNNVLLIGAGSRAKVTDFGMSKLTELNPRVTGLTKCPGTPAYMSPEAMFDPPVYTEKLDCFQAGVLMIQTITRKFPDPGPAMNRVRDARFPTGWINAPVPEVDRRQNHLSLVPQTHPMLHVAMDCLKDMDSERPTAQQICQDLSALKEAPEYGQSLGGMGGERDGEVQEREELIQQMRQEREREVREKEREIRERERDNENLQSQLQQKETEVRDMGREIERLQNIIQERESGGIPGLQEASESSALLLHEEEQTIHQLQQAPQSAPSYTCLVSGPGLQSATANHPTHVIVELSDSIGRPCSLQQNVTAELQPPVKSSPTQAAVLVISPSEYEVSYTAVRRGQHKLHVQVNGSEINGSPFTVTVYPDPTQLGPSMGVVVSNLKGPYGIAVNSCGEIVVTESQEQPRVHVGKEFVQMDSQSFVSVFDVRGQRVRTFGSHGDAPEQMIKPAGIAVDDLDNIYVSSQYKLQKFTRSGELIKYVSRWSSKEEELYDPYRVVTHCNAAGVAIHGNQVYVCDPDNHRIQIFDLDLNFIQYIGSDDKRGKTFTQPYDVAFDTAGNMYVAEFGNKRVQVIDSSGQLVGVFGQEREGKLKKPTAIHIVDKYVYVSDQQSCIAVYQTSGHYITSFGNTLYYPYDISLGCAEEELGSPRCITSCSNGLIYVCDQHYNQVQTF